MPFHKPHSRANLLLPFIACLPLGLLALYPEVGEWTVFFGRFHPVILHLPIGILLLTALLELLQVVSFGHLKFSTRLPLFLGTIGAVTAMTLGVLLMSGEGMQGALIEGHFNWGIATAVAALVSLSLRSWPGFSKSKQLPWLYRGALALTCGIMGWASHQGASITHGETYLTAHMPWLKDAGPSEEESALATAIQLPLEQREVYAHLIAPILDSKCYECHQTRSFKGELVMDTLDGLFAGGENGPAIVPGSLKDSLAMTRVHLPTDNEEHMPPIKEPQLTADELSILEWWVEQGAAADQSIAQLNPSAEIAQSIETVSVSLLEWLKQPKEEPPVEITQADVDALRAAHADALNELRVQYPGILSYKSLQSADIAVSAFHETWTDAEIADLLPVSTQISELVLPEAELTTDSAQVINQMVNLKALDLRSSTIDDGFIEALELPALTRLNLFQTAVTDASLPAVAKFKSLQKLFLTSTTVSAEALDELQALLPDCVIVRDVMQ